MSLLQIQHINKSFGGNQLLSNISLHLTAGQIVGLVGSNGSGKTTLFNIISGLEKADSGKILFESCDISPTIARQRASMGIGRLFQQPRVFQNLSLEDNLLAAINEHPGEQIWNYFTKYNTIKAFETQNKKEAQQVLQNIGLVSKQYNKAGELSYGQQKLLSFGMLLINKPKIVLLDEFFAGVAVKMVEEMGTVLIQLAQQGIGILMVEHNIDTLSKLCNEVYRLENKKLSRTLDSSKYAK